MLSNISINCQSSIKISDGLIIYFDPYDIKEKINNADYIFIYKESAFFNEKIKKYIDEHTFYMIHLSY